MPTLIPGQPFPSLSLPFVRGGDGPIVDTNAPMTVIDVYRGVHCPRCKAHLGEIQSRLADFKAAGLHVVAVSTDSKERAQRAADEWDLAGIPIAHDLAIEQARGLGLAISSAIRDGEADHFAEPGVFFVKADGTLYGSIIQTFPFARPTADGLIEVGRIVKARDYPPRGGS